MKFTEFATYVRQQTKTDSVTFTDAEILASANLKKDYIAKEIAKKNEDKFGFAFFSNLVAGQRDYALPDEVLNWIKRVEVNIDGSKWKKIDETDLNFRKELTTDESGITTFYTGRKTEYLIFGKSLKILSAETMINVTNGLKLWAIIYPADFDDLTLTVDMSTAPSITEHGFPRAFHDVLANFVTRDFKESMDKPLSLTEDERNVQNNLALALDAISNSNQDRELQEEYPNTDGSEF